MSTLLSLTDGVGRVNWLPIPLKHSRSFGSLLGVGGSEGGSGSYRCTGVNIPLTPYLAKKSTDLEPIMLLKGTIFSPFCLAMVGSSGELYPYIYLFELNSCGLKLLGLNRYSCSADTIFYLVTISGLEEEL